MFGARPAGLIANHRRTGVAIAKLGADDAERFRRFLLRECPADWPARPCPPAYRPRCSDAMRTRHTIRPRCAAAGGLDVDGADLAPLRFVGRQQSGAAPAAQRRGKLPGNVDGIADAGIHAKAAGRNDEMRRIAGDEDAAVQVMLRQQQPLHPFGAMDHLVFDRRADDRLEQLRHVLVAARRRHEA